ncbi:hypothetical protein DY000_02060829 [Brassica cretica]|uniref:Uncharacterized protein n=1 Tax=Brassica cretica TaxID=69181 RepID=A0ABQ7B0N1_BRACR|nr:hypothetical protein DY000_02060829 [Brassica cretica]
MASVDRWLASVDRWLASVDRWLASVDRCPLQTEACGIVACQTVSSELWYVKASRLGLNTWKCLRCGFNIVEVIVEF